MDVVATTEQHPADAHSTDVVARDDSTAQEPSVDWGWHGHFPRAKRIAGWLSAGALFAMLIGNHENYVEDIWLISLGTLLVLMLVRDHMRSFSSRRR